MALLVVLFNLIKTKTDDKITPAHKPIHMPKAPWAGTKRSVSPIEYPTGNANNQKATIMIKRGAKVSL